MLTTCTTCQNNFETSALILKERLLGNLIKVFFECPYCGTEFHVMYHNEETKELQKRIDVARNTGDSVTFKRLQPIFKKKLDKLNNR